MPPLSFFPWRFLLDVCCSHFFLSRPSQGVLELSDLSKMFTSSLALVPFGSLLPNKSWQRCVGIYSVTPPFQLSDTCRIKKNLPPGSNFTGGRNLLQFRWINHLWAMGKREQLFRIRKRHFIAPPYLLQPESCHNPVFPSRAAMGIIKIPMCVTHGVARHVGACGQGLSLSPRKTVKLTGFIFKTCFPYTYLFPLSPMLTQPMSISPGGNSGWTNSE